jgi:CRP/FNR family transcriptional regulator, cyclic AMP receptor protein
VTTDTTNPVLKLCAGMPERTIGAGEVILREGERAGILYILIDGEVEVLKGDMQVNVVSDSGAFFGEMSVLLDAPHVATVRTLVPSRFYVSQKAAEFLSSDPAVGLAVSRLLARRLHSVLTYLADLKKQFEEHQNHLGIIDEVLEALVHQQGHAHDPGSDRDPDPNVY